MTHDLQNRKLTHQEIPRLVQKECMHEALNAIMVRFFQSPPSTIPYFPSKRQISSPTAI